MKHVFHLVIETGRYTERLTREELADACKKATRRFESALGDALADNVGEHISGDDISFEVLP